MVVLLASAPAFVRAMWLFGDAGEAGSGAPAPVIRARLLMALLGFLLLGLGMLAAVLLAGRHARRLVRQKAPARRPVHDAWYAHPIVPPLEESPGDRSPPEGPGEPPTDRDKPSG